jgi:hypothetical protein
VLNLRAYALVILFAIGLFAVGIVGIRSGWGLFSPPSREQALNPDAANDEAFEDGALDVGAVDLFFRVRPPANNEEIRRVEVLLEDVTLWLRDDDPSVQVAQVCLLAVYAEVNPNAPFPSDHEFLRQPACVALNEDTYALMAEPLDFFGEPLTNTVILNAREATQAVAQPLTLENSDDVSLNFWYPYDSFSLDLNLYVAYEVTLDDGDVFDGVIQPFLAWNLQTSGHRLWQIGINSASGFIPDPDFGEIPVDRVSFSFERPLVYRLIFPFFLVMMVLLIGMMPLLAERDVLVEICAAMLFGIFGLKGIIGPGEAMGQTVLDLSLIGLYVVLAFAAVLFFLNKVSANRPPAATEEPAAS